MSGIEDVSKTETTVTHIIEVDGLKEIASSLVWLEIVGFFVLIAGVAQVTVIAAAMFGYFDHRLIEIAPKSTVTFQGCQAMVDQFGHCVPSTGLLP